MFQRLLKLKHSVRTCSLLSIWESSRAPQPGVSGDRTRSVTCIYIREYGETIKEQIIIIIKSQVGVLAVPIKKVRWCGRDWEWTGKNLDFSDCSWPCEIWGKSILAEEISHTKLLRWERACRIRNRTKFTSMLRFSRKTGEFKFCCVDWDFRISSPCHLVSISRRSIWFLCKDMKVIL